jgi:hypothetical protein
VQSAMTPAPVRAWQARWLFPALFAIFVVVMHVLWPSYKYDPGE